MAFDIFKSWLHSPHQLHSIWKLLKKKSFRTCELFFSKGILHYKMHMRAVWREGSGELVLLFLRVTEGLFHYFKAHIV